MVKKGKYKLFNYLIENHLIYYKGLRKNDKIIAFAILEYFDFKTIEFILNDILRNKLIQYYAFQIDTHENREKLLVLNFEDSTKERIIKSFNYVQQKIIEAQNLARFQKEKNLESKFLSIITLDKNSKTSISKVSESLKISTENNAKLLSFFVLNLDVIKKTNSFMTSFLTLINNLEREGILIFNFRTDSDENIKVSSYFVEKSENTDSSFNIEDNINNFFHNDLIKRHSIKIEAIFNFLWRLEISNSFFPLNGSFNHFSPNTHPNSLGFSEINEEIEKNLQKNQIEHIRLGENLIFIEQSYLFLLLEKLDTKYITKILKKYYPKYIIYILILDESGYRKLIETEKIKLIENINLVHPNNIQDFNYQEFKRK